LTGSVIDAATGAPVKNARVTTTGAVGAVWTDPAGRFRLGGLEPGQPTVSVDAPGYALTTRVVAVGNGRAVHLVLHLEPAPLALTGVEIRGQTMRGQALSSLVIQGPSLRGAGSLEAALDRLPGVLVRRDTPGGSAEVSIRGSDADAVLVLLDGVPLNDPLTGVADVSAVPLSGLAQVRLTPGAQTSRFGPRAQAGVVELETDVGDQRGSQRWTAATMVGSLGSLSAELGAGLSRGAWSGRADVHTQRQEGEFDFRLPSGLGGAPDVRTNSDLAATSVGLAVDRAGAVHTRLRLRGQTLGRGLPGPGFNPARHARQEMGRLQGSGAMEGTQGEISWQWTVHAVGQETRFHDAAPPAGLPFDERSRLWELGSDLRGAWRVRKGPLRVVDAGVSLRRQSIQSEALDATRSPEEPLAYTGVWLGSSWSVGPLALDLRARADRDPTASAVHSTHDVTATWAPGSLALSVSHRSGFSPPTLADQYFRDGVGIRANPDLRAERVPSEVEAAATWSLGPLDLGASAYRGDVRDRIVWQPDFRFVWSPRNTDVNRRGADVWAAWDASRHGLGLRATWGYARVTYDRPGSADSVQLAYRPRHLGSVHASWLHGPWDFGLGGRYTGLRYPVPSPINALPSFWTWDAQASREWTLDGWTGSIELRVRRLFDSHAQLLFGYPDPGRTLSLGVRTGSLF